VDKAKKGRHLGMIRAGYLSRQKTRRPDSLARGGYAAHRASALVLLNDGWNCKWVISALTRFLQFAYSSFHAEHSFRPLIELPWESTYQPTYNKPSNTSFHSRKPRTC